MALNGSKKEKWLVSTSPEILERLTTEAESVAALFEKGEPLRSRLGEIESSLLNLLVGTVEGERKKSSLADSAAKPSRHIMRKALEYVFRHKWQSLYVGDLARAAKVTDRTLRRSFNHELAVAPKRYLKLRELNVVRRALRGKLGNSQKIRTIMSEHGVSEFGRFAVEYKALFGESPSETLRRKAAWSD